MQSVLTLPAPLVTFLFGNPPGGGGGGAGGPPRPTPGNGGGGGGGMVWTIFRSR
jgi:hypothetical protein